MFVNVTYKNVGKNIKKKLSKMYIKNSAWQ